MSRACRTGLEPRSTRTAGDIEIAVAGKHSSWAVPPIDTEAKVFEDNKEYWRGSDAHQPSLAKRAYQGAGVFGLQRHRLRARCAAERAGAADIPATVLEVRWQGKIAVK
jgi:hypothetical protein